VNDILTTTIGENGLAQVYQIFFITLRFIIS